MTGILKLLGTSIRHCWRFTGTLLLWTVWLALGILLAVQITIATSRELALPFWARPHVEKRLAELGIRGTFGPTMIDTGGSMFIQDFRIFHPTVDEPLLTADSVFVRFDPRWLAVGRIVPLDLEIEGGTLWLPPMYSPTGRKEAALSEISVQLAVDGSDLLVSGLSARLGALGIRSHGRMKLPPQPGRLRRMSLHEMWAEGVHAYLRLMRQLQGPLEWINRLEGATLLVNLSESADKKAMATADLDLIARRFRLPGNSVRGLAEPLILDGILLKTTFPIGGGRPSDLQLRCEVAHIEAPEERKVDDVDCVVGVTLDPASFRLAPKSLKSRIGTVVAAPWSARAITMETSLPRVAPSLSALFAGKLWSLSFDSLNLQTGASRLSVRGDISTQFIHWVGNAVGHPLEKEISLRSDPHLRAEVDLAAGWRPERFSGHVAVDAVVAHTVALDGASAEFECAGHTLRFKDITLEQGPSIARGSYWMDTQSHDFRFLLDGRLEPSGIGGWFHEWWPDFWLNFDFSRSVPSASVDVRGQWGRNSDLSVFVAAENGRTAIRGIRFDHVRTRLFVRPHFYDALFFRADQGPRFAHGTFARTVNWESRSWSRLEFDATSTMDLNEAARVIGIEGLGIVEPFKFSQPPQLRLSGQIDGPGSSKGGHRRVNLAFYAAGPGSYHDFPLKDISVNGTINDDDIVLDPIATGFAQGTAEGRVHLSGEDPSRRLGFDLRLKNAALGEGIRILEDFAAKRAGREPPKQSRLQEQIAAGRIDLAMSADGMFEDLLSYQGQGNAELTGADLAEIHLFGVLSQVLRRTLFNFSTLKLDAMQANFSIHGPKIHFPQIRVTGPRAAIDAKGDYLLDRKMLDATAKLYPFEQSSFILSNALGFVLTPLSEALEFKLTGPLDNPNWSFVYGPSNFLRALRGGNGSPVEPVNPSGK